MIINKYKIPFAVEKEIEVNMPRGEIAKIHLQDDQLFVWLMTDTRNKIETRVFKLMPTGVIFDDRGWQYLTSIGLYQWDYVYHIFEKEFIDCGDCEDDCDLCGDRK